MMPLSIFCYHREAQQTTPGSQFFILSKGNNAGMPALQPWINSFIGTAPNTEMRDFYFWLTWGLYKVNSFKTVHRGSVIPFINLQETRDLIMPAARAIYPTWQEFQALLKDFEKLEKRKNNLAEIIKATTTLQEYLIRNYFLENGIKL